MAEPYPFNPVDGSDYLAIGRAGALWFMASELDPDTPEESYDAEWSLIPIGSRGRGIEGARDLIASDVVDFVQDAIEEPIASYPCSHHDQGITFRPETPLSDASLTGIFRVHHVTGAAGYDYSEGVSGYQIFVTQPEGYVMVVVERLDGFVGLAAVLPPGDKPDDMTMMGFLDSTFAALRIEPLQHQLSLHP